MAPTRRRRPCARSRTERRRALGLAACAARARRRRPCAISRTGRLPTLSRAACAARVRRRRPCARSRTRRRPTLCQAARAARARVGRRAAGWRTGAARGGARGELAGAARTIEVQVPTTPHRSARWTHAAVLLPRGEAGASGPAGAALRTSPRAGGLAARSSEATRTSAKEVNVTRIEVGCFALCCMHHRWDLGAPARRPGPGVCMCRFRIY
jgi:hypothetical protein